MPVNIGNNLEINNNEINASQSDLFKKLNVAYAWTNTQTTSEGGTAVVLVNDGDILTTMECNDINKCIIGHGTKYSTSSNNVSVIINGKIYYYKNKTLTQIGTKSDYISVSGCTTSSNTIVTNCHAIDSSGKLWYINENNIETQIGTDTTWTTLGYIQTSYHITCGVNNGKLYYLDKDNTPVQNCIELENITDLGTIAGSNVIQGPCINNGYLYYINSSNATLLDSNNNWKYLYVCTASSNGYYSVLNNNNELYFVSANVLYKQNISNVKKVVCTTQQIFCITNDNKLYQCNNVITKVGDNYGTYHDISNGMNWSDISSVLAYSQYIYAISDGKLYKIKSNSNSVPTATYTQIGTVNNYEKVEGCYIGNTNDYCLGLAWTGDATTVTHTILTTKSPQTNDVTYIDEDLTKYSTIQSTGASTITDEYRTYNRDVSKDTSFTAIPPATIHETVSTIDFLRITNPNT